MAMRPCRECGQDVSTKAKTCPNCGVRKPGQREYSWKSLLIILVFLVGFVIWASSGDDEYTPSEPDLPSTVDLNAAVRNTGTQILVTNNDGFAWTACEIELNDGFFQEVARIAPGEQVAGGLLAFTRRDGERFQPSQYAVQTVAIDCDTPNGDGWYYGSF